MFDGWSDGRRLQASCYNKYAIFNIYLIQQNFLIFLQKAGFDISGKEDTLYEMSEPSFSEK